MKQKFGIVLSLIFLVSGAFAADFSLDQYKEEVRKNHLGYHGAMKKSQGASERSEEGSLIFSPTAFSEFQHTDDKRQTVSSTFQGNQTLSQTYSLGVSQQARFGLLGRLSYNIHHTTINGADPALVPQNEFYDGGLGLELSQPLWRNGFGRQLKLQEKAQVSSALAASSSEKYNATLILTEAESRYWRLATARELVRLQVESYDRALKIKDWQDKQMKQRLADESDLLQAKAALKVRELDLKSAQNEERLALKSLNDYRGQPSTEEVGATVLPPVKEIEGYAAPKRTEDRGDVITARHTLEATQANLDINRDRQLPSLDLVGSVNFNGHDPSFSDATSRSFTTQNPLYTVGVLFSVPLNFGGTSDVRSGYLKENQGAELTFRRRLQDQENDWTDLRQRLEDSQELLRIAIELESAQKLKLDSERSRFKQGRSTTYQISLFVQDYLGAQLSRVRALFQILNVRTQIKTYEEGGTL